MKPLRPFGDDDPHAGGRDLGYLIGWLESLANAEEDKLSPSGRGPKQKRYELVMDAIDLLNQAYEYEYHA